MIRSPGLFVRTVCAAVVVLLCVAALSPAPAHARRGDDVESAIAAAERDVRFAAEEAAVKIQQQVSATIGRVMSVRPASTFNVNNAVRAAQNLVRVTGADAARIYQQRFESAAETLRLAGGSPLQVARFRDRFDGIANDRLEPLTRRGLTDIASLVRNGRRVASIRGTLVGSYELFVSFSGAGRGPVKLGEVRLEEGRMVRGLISTAAAAEFFLAPLPGPTPVLTGLRPSNPLRAVRWLYRGGGLVVSAAGSRADQYVGIESQEFSLTGVDLLPEHLRIELDRRLEGSADFRNNPDGADGFFRGLTYTFRRIDEPAP